RSSASSLLGRGCRGGACRDRRWCRLAHRVDQPFHLVVGAHAGVELVPDDESRRRVHAATKTVGKIGLNALLVFTAVVAALPFGSVESNFCRVAFEERLRLLCGFAIPLVLGLKETVVHLPEFALLIGARRRIRRGEGVPVLLQRKIV